MRRHIDNRLLQADLTANELLADLRVSRATLPTLIEGLNELSGLAEPLSGVTDGNMDVGEFTTMFRGLKRNIEELYRTNEQISLLLSGTRGLIRSELRKLDHDLESLDKQVLAKEFLPGTHNGYSASFIEDFTDDSGREPIFHCGDREAASFGPSHIASIDEQEDALTLPTTYYAVGDQDMTMRVVESNVNDKMHTVERSGLGWYSTGEGYWRTTVKSHSPVTRSIPGAEGLSGVQVVAEFSPPEVTTASCVTIEPFSDLPMDLVQATLYESESDEVGMVLVDTPMRLDSVRTLYFPMRKVHRIEFLLNQPTYTRVSSMSSTEDDYKLAYDELRARLTALRRYNTFNTEPGLERLMFFLVDFFELDITKESVNNRYREELELRSLVPPEARDYENVGGISYVGTLVDNVMEALSPTSASTPTVSVSDVYVRDGLFDIVNYYEQLLKRSSRIYNTLAIREIDEFESESNWGKYNDPDGVLSPLDMIHSSGWTYNYKLGIYRVKLGLQSASQKGFFISKPISAEGDIGEVTLRVDDWNYRDVDSGRRDSVLTSIEYSVSNVSQPTEETDWIPILPHGVTLIESERLLLDELGKGMFRFPADVTGTITVYRNGTEIEVPVNRLIMNEDSTAFIGLSVSFDDISPENIFTVTYSPKGEHRTVDFSKSGFGGSSLTNASSSSGSGEEFESSGGRRQVVLKHYPYVDRTRLTLREDDDHIIEGPNASDPNYSPVRVQLADGTFATNLTDYSGRGRAIPGIGGISFIHSGKTLVFSEPVTDKFTVMYEHIDSNVRFRAVLRSNSDEIVTPKVYSVQVKAKTKRPNTRGVFE